MRDGTKLAGRGMSRRSTIALVLATALAVTAIGGPSSARACTTSSDCDDGEPLHRRPLRLDARLPARHRTAVACSDGNTCTTADVCNGGTCVGGARRAGCTPCQAVATHPAARRRPSSATTSGTSTLAGSCGDAAPRPSASTSGRRTSSGTATISTCGDATHLRHRRLPPAGHAAPGPRSHATTTRPAARTGEPNDHHGSRDHSRR